MRDRTLKLFLLPLILAIFLPRAYAQESCPPGPTTPSRILELIHVKAKDLGAKPTKADQDEAVAENIQDQPLTSPASKQATAPTGSSDAVSLIQDAGFPTLFALAAESGLATASEGKITLNLTPFDVLVALNPEVRDRQSLYEMHSQARRWGAAITFGGKGDSFDRDGDGQADPALESQDLQDIVNWEVRYRLSKSNRDRREKENYDDFFARTEAVFIAQTDAMDRVAQSVTAEAAETPEFIDPKRPECLLREKVELFLARPEIVAKIAAAANADLALSQKVEEAAEIIDAKPIWTLVAGGLHRKDDFGPDKKMAAIRGAMGGENRNFTLNLEWNKMDAADNTNPTMWKAGLEYSVLIFKGSALSADGIKLAGSGAYESYDDVPDAKFDTVARLNAKMDFPVAKGVKIPVSVTWANHHDLIEGESEVRGHIGFTFDLSEARKHFLPN